MYTMQVAEYLDVAAGSRENVGFRADRLWNVPSRFRTPAEAPAALKTCNLTKLEAIWFRTIYGN
jgi:hypothetical protein